MVGLQGGDGQDAGHGHGNGFVKRSSEHAVEKIQEHKIEKRSADAGYGVYGYSHGYGLGGHGYGHSYGYRHGH